ncbi:DHHC zinc finger domain containing protein [Entamoeba histolytica HM-1:IMSS-B]|uniref:Palmitoyltransferase n=1 Tax=Entamoeba histolytica HM-1:IMSS-B TaxID=885319 RepID=M3UPM8_ENTH1|nr:DHHC zinc finger domain containing protein [Entamoeba histolytica HM-1:IMSS-B]
MSFVCYYKCVTTNTEVPEITKMDISTYPPCSKCGLGKPERAHHCSKCKSCILEMDHHCNYIGNCVGFANKKYFLLLLFYVTLMILFVLLINTPLAIYAFFYPLRNPFYHCVFRLFDLVHCILGIYALNLFF